MPKSAAKSANQSTGPRLTSRGGWVLKIGVMALFIGSVAGNETLILLSIFGLCLLPVTALLNWYNLHRIDYRCRFPSEVFAQDPFEVHIGIHNTSHLLDRFSVEVENRKLLRTVSREVIPWLRAARNQEVRRTSKMLKRGMHTNYQVHLRSSFPLGLFGSERIIDAPMNMIVYPAPLLPDDLESALNQVQPNAEYSLPELPTQRGDFRSLREFQHGDPLKTVDWRKTARQQDLMVREFDPPIAEDFSVIFHSYRPDGSIAPGKSFERCMRLLCGFFLYCQHNGVAFDFTASFNHWKSMYISGPQRGVPGSRAAGRGPSTGGAERRPTAGTHRSSSLEPSSLCHQQHPTTLLGTLHAPTAKRSHLPGCKYLATRGASICPRTNHGCVMTLLFGTTTILLLLDLLLAVDFTEAIRMVPLVLLPMLIFILVCQVVPALSGFFSLLVGIGVQTAGMLLFTELEMLATPFALVLTLHLYAWMMAYIYRNREEPPTDAQWLYAFAFFASFLPVYMIFSRRTFAAAWRRGAGRRRRLSPSQFSSARILTPPQSAGSSGSHVGRLCRHHSVSFRDNVSQRLGGQQSGTRRHGKGKTVGAEPERSAASARYGCAARAGIRRFPSIGKSTHQY